MKKILLFAALMFCFVGADSASAQAFRWGPELNLGFDQDFGIGARVEYDVPSPPLSIIGSFDYYFPGGNYDYWEINGNVVYNFDVPDARTITPYAGAGLNIAHFSREQSDGSSRGNTDLGLNILGGARFDAGSIMPFVEFKGTIDGGDQFVITGGVLF